MDWVRESPARWDDDKARIVGAAPAGVFDARFAQCSPGDHLPGEWWRVTDAGTTVGYGWMDVVWGDAEIQVATAPDARGRGIGSFALERLETEAARRGLARVYNTVRATHPDREAVSAWLCRRGFEDADDGSLFRAVGARV